MKILVTGGAGFIGSHVVRKFVLSYPSYEIFNLDKLSYAGNLCNLGDIDNYNNYNFIHGDITDRIFVDDLFFEHSFDAVINLAAESHVDRSLDNPSVFANTNVIGTINLLDSANKTWVDKSNKIFYQISTDEVYGSADNSELFTENSIIKPNSPYSSSKASADHFVMAYNKSFGLPILISRCSNNYGPNQYPEKLIPVIIKSVLNKKPIPVYGNGLNIRDWLYVTDHADAIDVIFHNAKSGSIYNIGGNNEINNITLVKMICDIIDRKLGNQLGVSQELITFVKDRPGHDLRYAIDATKIKEELGWLPKISPRDGLEKTVDWYLEQNLNVPDLYI